MDEPEPIFGIFDDDGNKVNPKQPKKKLTPGQKAERKRRKEEFETIFVNGKQKRVRREPTIDGMPVDEFIRRNADPIFLHQNGMWELME